MRKSIITITFSPSLDKSFSSPQMIEGKKLYCSAPRFDAGGGGINVARALQRLGSSVTAIFPSGGRTGMMLERILEESKVSFVPVKVQEETRENIIINEKETGRHYQFIMPPPELNEQEYKDVLNMLESEAAGQLDYLVVSGSMPGGFPAYMFNRLSAFAKEAGCRLVVDTSGIPLVRALEAGVYLAKPNINELAKLTGRPSLEGSAIEAAAKDVLSTYKCEVLIVSLGRDGAMMVTHDRCHVFSVAGASVKSTVGAGDSMVAGMIHYLSSGRPLEEMVKFGVACGTAATLHEGTELCHSDDVEKIYELVQCVR